MEAVPLLTNLLNHHDSKVLFRLGHLTYYSTYPTCSGNPDSLLCVLQVLEHASVCLTRIAEAFAHNPEKLDELCNHGLVAQAASLISVGNSSGQASLSTSTYTVCTDLF